MQARSEETRRRIIAAGVELFDEIGYGGTSLQDLVERAQITKGAFYYHFSTKQAVAVAIIEEAESLFRETVLRVLADTSLSALDNVITLTFVIPQMHIQDKLTQVANKLRQSLAQVSGAGSTAYQQRKDGTFPLLTAALGNAAAAGDIRDGIDVDKLGWTMWATAVGNRLLCDATDADIIGCTADMWEIILPAIVTPENLPYFRERLERRQVETLSAYLRRHPLEPR